MKPYKIFAGATGPTARNAAIAFFLGALVSLSAAGLVFIRAQNEDWSLFLEMSQHQQEHLSLNIIGNLEAVESIAALYAASESVERVEFAKFAGFELADREGLRVLEWIPRIKAAERGEFERRAQSEGLVDFRITEKGPEGQLIAAGQRDEYFPVFYLEPATGNLAALGFDLASNPLRLAALVKARDSGRMSATGRISLVQANGDTYGILIFQPIYEGGTVPRKIEARREKLTGFALGVIDLAAILTESSTEDPHTENLDVHLFDLSAPADKQLLFPRQPGPQAASASSAGNCYSRNLQMADRVWSILHCPRDRTINTLPAIAVLIIGLLGSVLLAGFVRNTSMHQVKEEAFEKALADKEKRFLNILSAAPILIQSVDVATGNYLHCNDGWFQRLGYEPGELSSLNWRQVVHPDELAHCQEQLIRAESNGGSATITTRFMAKDGKTVWVDGSIAVHTDAKGKPVTTGVFVDVTQRLEAENTLRESEAKFSGILDIAEDAIISINQKNEIVMFNKGAEAIFGYQADEVMGNPVHFLLPKKFQVGHGAKIKGFRESSQPAKKLSKGREIKARRANGEEFSAEASISNLSTGDGFISTIILRDMTEQYAVTREHRRIANELTTLIETANAPIFGVDRDGLVNEWNRTAERLTLFKKKDIMGHNLVEEFITEDYKASVKEVLDKALRGEETANYEFPLYTKDGRRIDILLNSTSRRDGEGNIIGVFGVGQDITELKQAERQYRLLLDSTAEAIYGIDTSGNCTFVNPACLRMLGYEEPSDLIGKNMHLLMHHTRADGTHYPMKECRIYLAFREGRGSHVDDEVLWRADGSSFPAEYWSHPVIDNGKAVGSVVTFLDITEAKKAREEAVRLAALVENSVEFVCALDLNARVIYLNRAGQQLIGLENEEAAKGKRVYSFLAGKYRRIYMREVLPCIDSTGSWQGNFELQRFDTGQAVPVEATVFELKNADTGERTGFATILRDITERKRTELQLLQAAKLSTLGEMATGMAHELNQPLNVIKMAADNAMETVEEDYLDKEYLLNKFARISAQTDRAAEIIDHMRIFGRLPDPGKVSFDPIKTVRNALDFSSAQLVLHGMKLEVRIPDACSPVLGQTVRLEQVLLNLILNARQAMEESEPPEGKTHELRLTLEDDRKAKKVRIIVEDTGGGLPADLIDRIFEPFFTTKEVGKGTGLGLSISYGIIEEMGGSLEVANGDRGAVFTVTLPAADKPADGEEG